MSIHPLGALLDLFQERRDLLGQRRRRLLEFLDTRIFGCDVGLEQFNPRIFRGDLSFEIRDPGLRIQPPT
jgi:hypothetical protein